jgi:diacylglycerol kinase (ATP)
MVESFHFAFEGLFYVFNTQPNMRIQAAVGALALLCAWAFGVTRPELLQLLGAVVLVLLAEAMNTAVERVIDLHVEHYSQKAKIAKDVAAGCVLIAAVYALLVGAMVFANNEQVQGLLQVPPQWPERPQLGPLQIVLVGMLLLAAIVVWAKRATGSRAFLTGGVISGHTALGFLIATAIALFSRSAPLSALALAMALLLAQSRLQSDIHSLSEVSLGALLGVLLALLLFAWPASF